MTFTFTNRAEYIAQVIEWKANYAELSEAIRKALKTFKADQRGGGGCFYSSRDLRNLRAQANTMIDARHKSKVEAKRQYEAEHMVNTM